MKIRRAKTHNQTLLKYSLTFLVLFFLFCMLTSPAKYISQALNGISAWAFSVLPSVLPFMFFTRLLSSLGTMEQITKPFNKISQFLFKTPPISFYTFLMAILSGYPVGSKLVADLYLQGKITKNDAIKMTSFCSTSGPMFIIGAVGTIMFQSVFVGRILFVSHVIGAIINGLIFRFVKSKHNEKLDNLSQNSTTFDIGEIVLNSTLAILSVGCIITIFFIVIECLLPVFSLFSPNVSAVLEGLVEITKGSLSLSVLSNKFFAVCAASFIISFGGISTIIQSITMLSKVKMPLPLFILQKIMHGIFSCITTIILLLICKF